jgi:hypothetical protein
MNTTALTMLRTGATVALSVLVALGNYYPAWDHWISVAVLAAAVVGIHVIPAVGQTMVTIQPPTLPEAKWYDPMGPGGPKSPPPTEPLRKRSGQSFQGE